MQCSSSILEVKTQKISRASLNSPLGAVVDKEEDDQHVYGQELGFIDCIR